MKDDAKNIHFHFMILLKLVCRTDLTVLTVLTLLKNLRV